MAELKRYSQPQLAKVDYSTPDMTWLGTFPELTGKVGDIIPLSGGLFCVEAPDGTLECP